MARFAGRLSIFNVLFYSNNYNKFCSYLITLLTSKNKNSSYQTHQILFCSFFVRGLYTRNRGVMKDALPPITRSSQEYKTTSVCVISDDGKCYDGHKASLGGRPCLLWGQGQSRKAFEGNRTPAETDEPESMFQSLSCTNSSPNTIGEPPGLPKGK